MKNVKLKKLLISLLLCVILAVFTSRMICFESEKSIKANAAQTVSEIVIDERTKRILFESNADEKRPIASTTKILTALTVLKHAKLDEIVKVDDKAVGVEGSSIYLKLGDRLTVEELLYGLMLRSGNDAATALAIHVGGSVENFAKTMNEEAEKAGAKNSSFKTPHGLDTEGHFSTARDLALITAEAFKITSFEKIVGSKSYRRTDGGTWVNKNKILSTLDGGDGVKTGYTKKAGRCLVASATKNGARYISVVLNCAPMFERSRELINNCFNDFTPQKVFAKGEELGSAKIKDCIGNKIFKFSCAEDIILPLKSGERNSVEKSVDISKNLSLPLKRGQIIGKVDFYLSKDLIFSCKLVTINDIEKCGFKEILSEVAARWT